MKKSNRKSCLEPQDRHTDIRIGHPEQSSASQETERKGASLLSSRIPNQVRDDGLDVLGGGCNFENRFMQLALEEAQRAYMEGEVPVGCVIVKRDENLVIASSRNSMQITKNPNAHAEILAINEACLKIDNKNLSQCDIYITLEPCTMCVAAISNARLGRVYYSAPDVKQGAVENGVRFFTSTSCYHRPEIYSGIYKEESTNIIKSFFGKIRKNKL